MTLSKQQLLDLQEEVQTAKTNASELKGQQTATLTQLKADFECKTIEEAEEKLATMDATILTLSKKIEKGSTELEKLLTPEIKEEE